MSVSFANPWASALLAFAGALGVLFLWAERKRRGALHVFALPPFSSEIANRSNRLRKASKALVIVGMILLIIGIAAPRWGEAADEETIGGRDVIVVLDLSRSMSAEQPSRAELARRMLHDLGSWIKKRGGHRLGLVVFAAKPKLVVPLTRDYDHFLEAVSRFDPAQPPRELAPALDTKVASGTRIGAALRVAVDAHDKTVQSGQHILLISDGDDPAKDKEWIDGAELARQRSTRVHTVGVGDSNANARIPIKSSKAGEARDGWLWFGDDYVRTSLQEEPLRDIARRTGGEYLAANANRVPLGSWLRQVLEQTSSTEMEYATTGTKTPPSQHAWFLAVALLCLSVCLILEKLVVRERAISGEPSGVSRRVTFALVVLAIVLISAEPQADDFLRRGNEAFANAKHESALLFFERAETRTADPGLVAFNKAAALYRLGRFREAQLHYQRCLEDDQIPILRKAQALYNLGNCLVRQGENRDRRLLSEAIRAYELSLEEDGPESLRSDAKHNLEFAKQLWQAAPPSANEANDSKPSDPSHKQRPEMKNGKPNGKGAKTIEGPGGEPNGKQDAGLAKDAIPGGGTSPSLPDSDQPARLSADDVLRMLADAVRRIQEDQRSAERSTGRAGVVLKDW